MGGPRAVLTLTIVSLLSVTACGGGAGPAGPAGPTPTPTAGAGGAASGPPVASTSGASAGPAGSNGGNGGTSGQHQVPAVACSVISETDIQGLFGGDVVAVANDDPSDNTCSFSVTKANGLLANYAATTPQIVAVTFDNGYIGYDEEHGAMGDAVTRVDGLGAEAWLGLGAIHVDLGGENQLIVTTVFGAIYDATVIAGERLLLAKLVLART